MTKVRGGLGGGDSCSLFCCHLFPGRYGLDFGQAVAGAGIEIEGVELASAGGFQNKNSLPGAAALLDV
jgi:hypothetical protein